MTTTSEELIEFLNEMVESGLELDEALRDFDYLLEDTELDQALRDYKESRMAIKKTLKRIARDNSLEEALDFLD